MRGEAYLRESQYLLASSAKVRSENATVRAESAVRAHANLLGKFCIQLFKLMRIIDSKEYREYIYIYIYQYTASTLKFNYLLFPQKRLQAVARLITMYVRWRDGLEYSQV